MEVRTKVGSATAQISRLYTFIDQRHHSGMLRWEILLQLVFDIVRTLLAEESSERVRRFVRTLAAKRRPLGMSEIRRQVHLGCRRRLLRRLSTDNHLDKGV